MKQEQEAHSAHTIFEKCIPEDIKESRGSRFLSDVIDFLPDATFAIDNQGKVLTWNRAMEKMTGASAADMVGKGNYEYALPFTASEGRSWRIWCSGARRYQRVPLSAKKRQHPC